MSRDRTLVVGGGIAGLALAAALRRIGREVELVERAPAWAPLGAGIVLSVNAMSVLRRLGLATAARARGHLLGEAAITDRRGRPLARTDLAELRPRFGDTLSFHRAELHALLLEAAGDLPLRLGTTLDWMAPFDGGVRVRTSDGAEREYALVVGADGLRSQVRGLLFGENPPVYAGYTCWRVVVRRPPQLTGAREMWGRGRRFGLVPLSGDRLYCFAVANAPPGTPACDPETPERFRTRFADFGGAVPDVLAQIERPEQLLHNDLEEVWQRPWQRGAVVLVGDAAHAMTPNMGQGAAMALEDVWVLADLLSEKRPLADALSQWEARRGDRVRFVQRTSRRIGRIGQLEGGLGCALRDGLLRLLPDRLAANALVRLASQPI